MIISFYKFVKNFIYSNIIRYYYLLFNNLSTARKINNKLMEIEYLYEGTKYKLYIPIDNRLLTKMVCYDTYLIEKDGRRKKLNLQPGVLTNLNPEMFNCKEILLDNVLTKNVIICSGKDSITYI
jgi:hypothetical protein